MGRCWRRRNTRKKTMSTDTMPEQIKALYKWMTLKGTGINMSSIALRNFSDTGRGIMAKKSIKVGDLVIAVPQEYFVNTTLIPESPLKHLVERFSEKISPVEAMSLLLLHEKNVGEKSVWFPYLKVLPESFSMPIMWKEEDLKFLPHWVLTRIDGQKKDILKSFRKLKKLLSETGNIFADSFLLKDFLWAWAVINSRSAYMPQPHEKWLNNEPNNYVLIPFLDMFNHTPSAKVVAGFNSISKCYEIRTLVAYKKYEQVFINYGGHDNVELLISYGFVCPRNPFDSISFTIDEVFNATKHVCTVKGDIDTKLKLIKTRHYDKNILISHEGPSWSLLNILKILTNTEAILYQEESIDPEVVQKVIRYLTYDYQQLPYIKNMNSNISSNVFLAKQLCSSFKEIIVLDEGGQI